MRKENGWEAWRIIWKEYLPGSECREASPPERVMDSVPKPDEDLSCWYFEWLELIRLTELARQRPIDDGIKCAVALRRIPN